MWSDKTQEEAEAHQVEKEGILPEGDGEVADHLMEELDTYRATAVAA